MMVLPNYTPYPQPGASPSPTPPMGGGMVTGAGAINTNPVAGPIAVPQLPTTGAGGQIAPGFGAVAGSYNYKNPESVIRDYMRQNNLDPNINSGFGTFIKNLMGKIVPVLFNNMYGSNGQPSMDKIGDPMAMLSSIFGQGQLGSNLNNFANSILAEIQGNANMRNLEPAAMQRMLTDINALQTFGLNPYQSMAEQNALDQALANYEDTQYQISRGGKPNNLTLWDYIAQNAAGAIGLR